MGEGATNVRYEAIATFEEALGRFAQVALDRLRLIETTIRRTVESLEGRRSELRREIAQLREEIADADDETDTSSAQQRLEDAAEALANVRRWQEEVQSAVQRYRREAEKLENLSTGETVNARAYLRSLLDNLAAYFALQKDGTAGAANICAAPTKPTEEISGSQQTAQDIAAFRSQEGRLAIEAKTREYKSRVERFPELGALSFEEYLALNRYSQFDYERINPALRANDVKEIQTLGPRIRIATKAMRKLPAYEGPVFRGASYLHYADRYVPGAIVCEPGFTSTSKNPRLKFPGALQYVILSKTGRDICSCSAFGDREEEVLFEPNTRFEVLERFEVNNVTTISMREL